MVSWVSQKMSTNTEIIYEAIGWTPYQERQILQTEHDQVFAISCTYGECRSCPKSLDSKTDSFTALDSTHPRRTSSKHGWDLYHFDYQISICETLTPERLNERTLEAVFDQLDFTNEHFQGPLIRFSTELLKCLSNPLVRNPFVIEKNG